MSVVEQYKEGKFRAICVVGRLGEGFDHKNVSVVGIARNLGSRLLFDQFVGRCCRKANPTDPVTGCIISHPKYGQQSLWDTHGFLPKTDQDDDENEDGMDDDEKDSPYQHQEVELTEVMPHVMRIQSCS
jgi:superfamily II DNA or RNA helicase